VLLPPRSLIAILDTPLPTSFHPHQVLSVWEALLFLHSSLGERPSGPVEAADVQLMDEPLTEFVTSRVESGAAGPADKAAANKKMVKVGLLV